MGEDQGGCFYGKGGVEPLFDGIWIKIREDIRLALAADEDSQED